MASDKPEEAGLAEQLRQAIRDCGQTLNQLSTACGVGRDRLSRFVRGERDMTVAAADKICRALGLRLTGPPVLPGGTPPTPARPGVGQGEGQGAEEEGGVRR